MRCARRTPGNFPPRQSSPPGRCRSCGGARSRQPILAMALLLLPSLAGCGYRPLFGPPGPQPLQQQNASLHDPYSDNDLGPEVVGGRPRDFQKPLAEPVRNRWLKDSWWIR
jgi:predicted small lipoprotein YifL